LTVLPHLRQTKGYYGWSVGMTEIYLGMGANGERQVLNLRRANRHGLIAGATGTGKTVTLQGIAENFSAQGVPVFLADVKGDLSGISMAGSPAFKNAAILEARAKEIGLDPFTYAISEMGPLLLARLLDLNETQEGVLNIVFRYADEQGLLLLDLDDLQAMLSYTAENAAELTTKYGNVTKQSVGTIQRQLLSLDSQGGAQFFGEPALEIEDFLKVDDQGRGMINVLAADKLMRSPKLYATFLLWLLAELFEVLPEVGDPEKPKLVFFFDEAHLLFAEQSKALQDKIEQVVRLIRSKGVGVYFVTQNPIDIPEEVAGQLGNRVQHALRAFTPRDQKAIKAAAETFRINKDLDVETAITELKVGEALVSTLMEDGAPSVVQRTLIAPPRSRLGPISDKERAIIRSISPVDGKYDTRVNRESAQEVIAQKIADAAVTAQEVEAEGTAEVGKRERKSTSMWGGLGGKVATAVAGAAAASAGSIIAGSLTGHASRANPKASAASAAAGTVANELGKAFGIPGLGRFARNLIGGLMR
jgi:DNA helicase HerA-like ATPase